MMSRTGWVKFFLVLVVVAVAVGSLVIVNRSEADHALAQTCAEISPGPLHWWPGDGDALDIVGGNNGALVGNTTFAAGRIDQAFSFDGADSYVDLGMLNVPGGGITIEAWINPNSLDDEQRIVSKANGVATSEHWWALIRSLDKVQFRLKTTVGDSAKLTASSGSIPVGQWTHLAATYDGGMMRVYQDSVEVGSFPKSGAVASGSGVPAWIGANPPLTGDGREFDGAVDEVSIYNRALSRAEIQEIFAAGVAGKCKFATGFWSLSGNADTTAQDNFLGTTDNADLVFRTNNTERMRIDTSGNVFVDTSGRSAFAILEDRRPIIGGPVARIHDKAGDGIPVLQFLRQPPGEEKPTFMNVQLMADNSLFIGGQAPDETDPERKLDPIGNLIVQGNASINGGQVRLSNKPAFATASAPGVPDPIEILHINPFPKEGYDQIHINSQGEKGETLVFLNGQLAVSGQFAVDVGEASALDFLEVERVDDKNPGGPLVRIHTKSGDGNPVLQFLKPNGEFMNIGLTPGNILFLGGKNAEGDTTGNFNMLGNLTIGGGVDRNGMPIGGNILPGSASGEICIGGGCPVSSP